MKKVLLTLTLLLTLVPTFAAAQTEAVETYYRAEVLEILSEEVFDEDTGQIFQSLKVKITSGDEKDREVVVDGVGGTAVNGGQPLKVGDRVIINKTVFAEGDEAYYLIDIYRIPYLYTAIGVFLIVVLAFSRWRGLSSLLGLGISILVIVKFVAPQILAGRNPLLITLIAVTVIAITSLYLAHGYNKRTSIALISTFITLAIALVLAYVFVHMTKLFGIGSEESLFLQVGATQHINLQGLLLAGIILGALGVLDDITTAQSATVDELKKANPSLSFKQLYAGAASVGSEHISSLINTLFLAYAGVSLPLFLLFTSSADGAPIWVTLNAEFIAEEIVRTLVGSITLILAVPITTLLAAYYFDKNGPTISEIKHIH